MVEQQWNSDPSPIQGNQRAGAATALVHQTDSAVIERQHRLDAQCTAHEGDRSGQTPAFLQVLQAVHNGNNAHPLFKAVQLGGNAGRGQPLLAQADGLTHNDSLALGGSLRINDIDLGVGLGSCQQD